MEGVTAVISLGGAVAAFLLGPVAAVALYFLQLFYYPQPLTLPVGTIEFSSGRIVILGLLANAFLRGGRLRRFRPGLLDLWVLISFFAMVLALLTNEDMDKVLENRGGAFFDYIMPYFAVRLMIDDREKLVRLVQWITVGMIPLALMGAFESKTGHNPYGAFERYYSWGLAGNNGDPVYIRHGFYRACSSVGNYISFGMVFAGLAPLALSMWHDPRWRRPLTVLVFAAMMLGLMASMSSGPLFSIAVSLAMVAVFRFREKWPLFAVAVVAAGVFVEVFSNRHFYHVLTLFAFDPENAYYRIGLIEEAFGGGMAGHWFTGYGYVGIGIGSNNANFHWEHTDLTNIYVYFMAWGGLLALLPYLVVNYLYYRRLYQAAQYATETGDAWLLWCFGASLVGWNIAMMTVMALAQVETMLFMFIALCANMPAIMRRRAEELGTAGDAPPAQAPVACPRAMDRMRWRANA